MKLLKMFASTAHITYNKYIAKQLGVDEAILFGELCSKYEQFTDGEIGTDDDEFYCTMDNLVEDTCLTEYRIRNAMKNLVKTELLSVIKKGIPAKNWYKLNENKLLEMCDLQRTSSIKFNTTSDGKNVTTSDGKFNTTFIKKENKKEIIKNNISVKPKKQTKKDRILKLIEKKILEYDIISETIIDNLYLYYQTLIDNNKMITTQKLDAEFTLLKKYDTDTQLQIIKNTLDKGYQALYEPKNYNNTKNSLISHEQDISDSKGNNVF